MRQEVEERNTMLTRNFLDMENIYTFHKVMRGYGEAESEEMVRHKHTHSQHLLQEHGIGLAIDQ